MLLTHRYYPLNKLISTLPFGKTHLFVISIRIMLLLVFLYLKMVSPRSFAWITSTPLSNHLLREAFLECLLGLWYHSSILPIHLCFPRHSIHRAALSLPPGLLGMTGNMGYSFSHPRFQHWTRHRVGTQWSNRIALSSVVGSLENTSKVFQLNQWIRWSMTPNRAILFLYLAGLIR